MTCLVHERNFLLECLKALYWGLFSPIFILMTYSILLNITKFLSFFLLYVISVINFKELPTILFKQGVLTSLLYVSLETESTNTRTLISLIRTVSSQTLTFQSKLVLPTILLCKKCGGHCPCPPGFVRSAHITSALTNTLSSTAANRIECGRWRCNTFFTSIVIFNLRLQYAQVYDKSSLRYG